MGPLRPGDPARVGGYVLLGRLGAGGMGVVYLGRSAGGGLAAVKVIRAEYAADAAFRARFRREVEATRRLRSRWLVPATAADPDGREPWLATAYVPGLPLAEAVDGHGPLPEPAVRVLGARLAEALACVHAAGLVHRDVKPGNILLAPDGPHLIDFGIVRPEGATMLTASDLVIGSPGFLSPEQAEARSDEVSAASDVFSLGCALAYAATGRRPFGSGTVAGVLYQTVHEEPDIEGAPPALLPVLRACLAKAPARRPTAAALRDGLTAREDGAGHSRDTWLPAPYPQIIAERAAAVLALPNPVAEQRPDDPDDPDDTDTVPSPHRTAAPTRRTRPSRRALLLGLGAAGVTAGGLTAAGLLSSHGARQQEPGPLPRYTIGLQADLSGPLRVLGLAQERGARLAVRHFNARAKRPFDLLLSVGDDRGEAGRAAATANRFIDDRAVQAVVGPTGDAGIEKIVDLHQQALLPLVSVSTPAAGLVVEETTAFFQLRADENVLASGFRSYLTSVARSEHTAVVDDRAATGDGAWRLGDLLRSVPPSRGTTTVHRGPADGDDFGPAAEAVAGGGAQAVVYVGSSRRRAARCAGALERAGFEGVRMVPEPVLRPELPEGGGAARLPFLDEAGNAAEGWLCVTTYADPTRLPAARDFVTAYRRAFPGPPAAGTTAPFAVEAYDAVLLIASALRPPADGGPERGATTRRLRSSHREGLAKPLAFDQRMGTFRTDPGTCLYRVRDGEAVFLGSVQDVVAG